MQYVYTINYIYTSEDGKTERGHCDIKANSMFNAVYQFYLSHGFKYEVTGWNLTGIDSDGWVTPEIKGD